MKKAIILVSALLVILFLSCVYLMDKQSIRTGETLPSSSAEETLHAGSDQDTVSLQTESKTTESFSSEEPPKLNQQSLSTMSLVTKDNTEVLENAEIGDTFSGLRIVGILNKQIMDLSTNEWQYRLVSVEFQGAKEVEIYYILTYDAPVAMRIVPGTSGDFPSLTDDLIPFGDIGVTNIELIKPSVETYITDKSFVFQQDEYPYFRFVLEVDSIVLSYYSEFIGTASVRALEVKEMEYIGFLSSSEWDEFIRD